MPLAGGAGLGHAAGHDHTTAVGAVLEPIRTLQGLIGRRGGARRWRRLMLIRFRSREAAMAVLRPLCHCPGPLGMGAIDRRVQLLEDFEADARRLRYLLHEL